MDPLLSYDDRLSIVFPMWNEEAMIRRTVAAAHQAGARLRAGGLVGSYEVVLVDDASSDATGKIADELADDDPRVVVVHHPENRKLGGSLKSGFGAASGDIVLYTDADLPCELVEADKALRLMRLYEADIVSAYRFDRTAEGAQRALYSFVYNHLVRWVLKVRVRDVNFAFKLVRRRVLDHVELRERGQLHRRRAGGQGAPAASVWFSSAWTTSPAPGAPPRCRRPRSSCRCCGSSRPLPRHPHARAAAGRRARRRPA